MLKAISECARDIFDPLEVYRRLEIQILELEISQEALK